MRRAALVFAFLLSSTVGVEIGSARDGRVTIEWPDPAFRDLQAAIDAAPDGATVEIGPGVHPIERPIFVLGRRLVIKGAGSGRKGEKRITHLVGPPPRPVTDEEGNLVLRAAAVEGLFNFVGAGSTVQDLKISGFDAGIVTKDDPEGRSGPTIVHDLIIADTGRGILSLASSDLTVKDTTIQRSAWNGISVASSALFFGQTFEANAIAITDPEGAGIYFENTTAVLVDVVVTNAAQTGILGVQSAALILDSLLFNNKFAGILLFESKLIPLLQNNQIVNTLSLPNTQTGDAIMLWLSEANVWGNFIY